MAVLGKIRQRSIFLILVIGMALFAFVISGVFDGSSSNAGPTDPIAVVNDEEIDVTFFRQMVEQTERAYNYSTLQSVNLVWNQALRNTIFDQEFKKLGIDAGKDQLEQIISSDEAVIPPIPRACSISARMRNPTSRDREAARSTRPPR